MIIRALSVSAALLLSPIVLHGAPPSWEHPAEISAPEGHAQVIWSTPRAPGEDQFELQIRLAAKEFQTVYEGGDRASVLSGLPEGDSEVRVRTIRPERSEWSTTVVLTTHYPSRGATLGWMTLGGILFVATVGYLLVAARRSA